MTNLLREYLSKHLLVEGPLEKMRNMGVPEEVGTWIIEFLPEYSKNHALWYSKVFAKAFHQLKDYLKQYKVAKKQKKDPKLISLLFEKLKDVIYNTKDDIAVIDRWAEKTNTNLGSKKRAQVVIGDEVETVEFDFATAVKVAKQYFDIQEGSSFMQFEDGWNWLDRQTHYCSVEGKMMGHCGMSDNEDSNLFSLRDSNGLPHVTAEILMADDGATVYQMKGKQNSTPDKKYWPKIFALLTNPELELKNYHAAGNHGGDLTWEMIPEETQLKIAEVHEGIFEGEEGLSIEKVLDDAAKEVEEAIANFKHEVLYVDVDASSWEPIDDQSAWIQVSVGGSVEIGADVYEALEAQNQFGLEKILGKVLGEWDLGNLSWAEVSSYGGESPSVRFDIEDTDLSTSISIEHPEVREFIGEFEYYISNNITIKDFQRNLRNLLVFDKHIETVQDQRFEDLDNMLSRVYIEMEADPTDEDFNVIKASVELMPIDRETYSQLEPILKDKRFAQEFFGRLVDKFSPSLQQSIMPNVEVGAIKPFSAPVSATIESNAYSSSVTMNVAFHEDDESYEDAVEFLKAVDNHTDQVRGAFVEMLKFASR